MRILRLRIIILGKRKTFWGLLGLLEMGTYMGIVFLSRLSRKSLSRIERK